MFHFYFAAIFAVSLFSVLLAQQYRVLLVCKMLLKCHEHRPELIVMLLQWQEIRAEDTRKSPWRTHNTRQRLHRKRELRKSDSLYAFLLRENKFTSICVRKRFSSDLTLIEE